MPRMPHVCALRRRSTSRGRHRCPGTPRCVGRQKILDGASAPGVGECQRGIPPPLSKLIRGGLMRKVILAATVLAVAGMVATNASAIGIPAKAKAKKLQGNLVPAFSPADTGPNTGDDENDSPAFLDTATPRSNCTFEQGQYKLATGAPGSIKLSGVKCGGTLLDGQLCAQTKILEIGRASCRER